MESITDDRTGRAFFVQEFGSFRESLTIPGGTINFNLLVLSNETTASADIVRDWIEACLDRGLSYLCAWGKDSRRIHDIGDEVIVQRQITGRPQPHVSTTDHYSESLDDALYLFVNLAWPPDPPWDTWTVAIFNSAQTTSAVVTGIRKVLNQASA